MTVWSERINSAMRMAAEAHAGQIRKADGSPYIAHPFAVAWILASFSCDEDTVVAGLLHDVLEDTLVYNSEDIEKKFGKNVLSIVREVSEEKDATMSGAEEKATWEARKTSYIAHLGTASQSALSVSAADKIHNLESMMECYASMGPALWSKFNCPEDKKMWFYEEVSKIISVRLPNSLAVYLAETVERAKKLFQL